MIQHNCCIYSVCNSSLYIVDQKINHIIMVILVITGIIFTYSSTCIAFISNFALDIISSMQYDGRGTQLQSLIGTNFMSCSGRAVLRRETVISLGRCITQCPGLYRDNLVHLIWHNLWSELLYEITNFKIIRLMVWNYNTTKILYIFKH